MHIAKFLKKHSGKAIHCMILTTRHSAKGKKDEVNLKKNNQWLQGILGARLREERTNRVQGLSRPVERL